MSRKSTRLSILSSNNSITNDLTDNNQINNINITSNEFSSSINLSTDISTNLSSNQYHQSTVNISNSVNETVTQVNTIERNENTVILISSDNETFEVSLEIAYCFELVKIMIEDGDLSEGFHLPNIASKVLVKVIEFATYHLDDPIDEIEKPLKSNILAEHVQNWYVDFIKLPNLEESNQLSEELTYDYNLAADLLLAANYLDFKPLFEFGSLVIATGIRKRSPESIRKIFQIKNDFTPEQEAKVREENQWALDELENHTSSSDSYKLI